MSRRIPLQVAALGLVLGVLGVLAGCEKSQALDSSARKLDAQAWTESEAANPAFMAPGWKAGDKTAWEEQMRKRNQAQNDYAR